MFCANCGKKRELENRFCTSCGTPFDESISQETTEQIQGSAEVASKNSISLKLNKKVLGIIAVLLVAGFFVFKGMNGNVNSPEGVVQTFLTAIDELDGKKFINMTNSQAQEEERKEALSNLESEIDDLRELKERLIDYLGRSFAKPDNIEVIERDGNEFVVRADYTTSYRAGSSDYDELFFEVVLKDGKYYIDYFDLYH